MMMDWPLILILWCVGVTALCLWLSARREEKRARPLRRTSAWKRTP
jgi:hypothetical protein